MSGKKILIAEDNASGAELLEKILQKANYTSDTAKNGKEAYNLISNNKYDALLTDWMMPMIDGIELIRKVRENISPPPVIVMLTALCSVEARMHALNSGADDFFAKPYDPKDLLGRLNNLFSRVKQKPGKFVAPPVDKSKKRSSFVGVCIASSSGGPQTLRKVFKELPTIDNAAFFIVQHGPAWALRDMATNWNTSCELEIVLAANGMKAEPGMAYLAPGNFHMTITPGSHKLCLEDGPPENYVKPAADPLMKSVAKCFGSRSIAVILTGMGCDGTMGAKYIASVNGVVIAQDPETALVSYMPKAVINNVDDTIVIPLLDIPATIIKHINQLSINNIKKAINQLLQKK